MGEPKTGNGRRETRLDGKETYDEDGQRVLALGGAGRVHRSREVDVD